MNYLSFYNKYRPNKFDQVCGQRIIKQILINSIKKKQLHHTYIFSGSHGIGKTTLARLFGKAVNCSKFVDEICNECKNCKLIDDNQTLDIAEIDAASNNGVEYMRDLISNVYYEPFDLHHKVYIIDEAHMLTQQAWNSLLKIIEEPPLNVIFLFLTTNVNKIIPTIQSRCQKFFLNLMEFSDLEELINNLAKKEEFSIDDQAKRKIIQLSNGSARDCYSIIQQSLQTNEANNLNLVTINSLFNLVDEENQIKFIQNFHDLNIKFMKEELTSFFNQGKNFLAFFESIMNIALEMNFFKLTNNIEVLAILSLEQANVWKNFSFNWLKLSNILLKHLENFSLHHNHYFVAQLILANLIELHDDILVADNKKNIAPINQAIKQIIKPIEPQENDNNITDIVLEQNHEVQDENFDHSKIFSHHTIGIYPNKLNIKINNNLLDTIANDIPFIIENEIKNNEAIDNDNVTEYSNEELLSWCLKHKDKQKSLKIIEKFNLNQEKKILNCSVKEIFNNLENKIQFIGSQDVIVVIFKNDLACQQFLNYIQNSKFVDLLNSIFQHNYYWASCTAEELKQMLLMIKKIELKVIKSKPKYVDLFSEINKTLS